MNWVQYACDTTRQQLKRATKLALCGRSKLSSIITTQSTQVGYQIDVHLTNKDGQDEECFLLEGMKELKVFMPNQITLMKKLLENAKSAEQNRHPKRLAMHAKYEYLQSKVNSWVTTLIHLKKCLEMDKSKFP